MARFDAVVVGAGPSGSTFAHHLARRGRSVLVVEEHPRVGRPVQCAGLVSQRVLDLAGSTTFVEREVRGAAVFGPSGRSFRFHADVARAFAIDRAGLDIALGDRAVRSGAEIRAGTRFDGVIARGPGSVRLGLSGADGAASEVDTGLVVGADGVASAVARAFRLRRPVEILPAFEAEFPRAAGDDSAVEVYLGRTIAPGLFGWWIPDGRGGARVGVASNPDGTPARTYFDRLLDRLEAWNGTRLANPTSLVASGIPIGTVPRYVGDRVLLVGDAAAQVKPLSGGGIYTGMKAAELAAEVADRALAEDDLSERALAAYPRAFDAELGEEFRRAQHLRRLFVRLSDRELDAVVDALVEGGLASTVVAFGDIDFPTHAARQLLRASPGLVRLLPKALGAWLGSSVPYPAPDLDPFADVRRK